MISIAQPAMALNAENVPGPDYKMWNTRKVEKKEDPVWVMKNVATVARSATGARLKSLVINCHGYYGVVKTRKYWFDETGGGFGLSLGQGITRVNVEAVFREIAGLVDPPSGSLPAVPHRPPRRAAAVTAISSAAPLQRRSAAMSMPRPTSNRPGFCPPSPMARSMVMRARSIATKAMVRRNLRLTEARGLRSEKATRGPPFPGIPAGSLTSGRTSKKRLLKRATMPPVSRMRCWPPVQADASSCRCPASGHRRPCPRWSGS